MNIKRLNNTPFNGYIKVSGYKQNIKKTVTECIDTNDVKEISHSADYNESIIRYIDDNNKLSYMCIPNNPSVMSPLQKHYMLLKAYTAACQNSIVTIAV